MEKNNIKWTIDTYAAHNEALRAAEEKFQIERDRRYLEINTEKEKAVIIKETADLAALKLARDIQVYKDEKANELRAQIERERVTYATKNDLIASSDKVEASQQSSDKKIEAVLKPILEYVASQQGGIKGVDKTLMYIIIAANIIIGIIMFLLTYYKG